MAIETVLIVHGAWYSGATWGPVVEALVERGHRAVALDRPGTGLYARYPVSYLARDQATLRSERSPLAGMGIDELAEATAAQIRRFAGHGPVVLVGHSFGGQIITRAAEQVPELIRRLVYVAAYCPVRLGSAAAYNALPENRISLSETMQIGDPAATGAVRVDPRDTDPARRELGRLAFFHDIPTERYEAVSAYLMPDHPLRSALDDARGTPGRWGRIPRRYIRCTLDRAIPIALQDRMIAEADEATPGNRFEVATLPASHSPFLSMPDRLAGLLV